ncbi:hypothetical protein ACOSQ2_004633 [Xanthoceras sorbifolium]
MITPKLLTYYGPIEHAKLIRCAENIRDNWQPPVASFPRNIFILEGRWSFHNVFHHSSKPENAEQLGFEENIVATR